MKYLSFKRASMSLFRTVLLLISFSVYCPTSFGQLLSGPQKVVEPEPIPNPSGGFMQRRMDNFFGNSVAIDGDYAVVGSFNSSLFVFGNTPYNIPSSGTAFIYKKTNGVWNFMQQISPSDRTIGGDWFGRSVAIKGNLIIVGAPIKDDPNNPTPGTTGLGLAYIYELQSGNNWLEIARISATQVPATPSSQFGGVVAIDANYAVISQTNNGARHYVFRRTNPTSTNWVIDAVLPTVPATGGDVNNIAIDGDHIFIGADNDNVPTSTGTEHGRVYVYTRANNSWTTNPPQIINAANPANAAHFGRALSVSGDYAVIGCPQQNTNASGGSPTITGHGAAYVFLKNSNGQWVPIQKVVAPDRGFASTQEENILFGTGVDIDGNYFVVGAPSARLNEQGQTPLLSAGAAYIFKKSGNNPTDQWLPLAPQAKMVGNYRDGGQSLGFSVGISGRDIILGAPQDSDDQNGVNNLQNAGSAFFYERTCELTINKYASASTITAGNSVTYSIELCNECNAPLNNVKVTDVLAANVIVQNPGNFSYNAANNSLSTTIASLPPGCTTLVFTATPIIQVNNCGGSGVNFNNCATAEILGSGQAPISSCVNVNVVPGYSTGTVLFSQLINNGTLLPLAGAINAINTAQTITVYGHWIVDVSTYNFAPNSVIRMGPGAQITILVNNSLKITNSVIRANSCGKLWRSFTVDGKLIFENNRVQDGQYAVEARNKSTIFMTNNDFINNFIGIFVPPSLSASFPPVSITQSVNFNPIVFIQNIFRSNNTGILPGFTNSNQYPENPQAGQPGLAGIYVNDLLLLDMISFSPVPVANINNYQNLVAGIVGIRSNMKINNAAFTDISDNTSYNTRSPNNAAFTYKGTGIFTDGTNGKYSLLHLGFGAASNNSPSFNRCYNGVVAITASTQIENNRMLRIRESGAAVILSPRREHLIANNSISISGDRGEGIALLFNDPAPGARIGNNEILLQNNNTATQADGAIFIAEAGNLHPMLIRNNIINLNNASFGIFTTGNLNGKIFENNVNLNANFPGRSALVSFNSNTAFSCNDVLGTAQSINTQPSSSNPGLNQNAFWGFNALNQIACNTFDRTQVGTRFDGTSNNVQFQGNRFDRHYYGLWLTPGTTIQDQFYAGNRFVANTTQLGRLEGFLESTTTLNTFRVGVPEALSPQLYPNPRNNQGWFSFASGGIDFDCNANQVCPLGSALRPISTNSIDSLLALGSFSTNAYQLPNEYKGKRQLYRKLKEMGNSNNPLFQNFQNTHASSTIGQLDWVQSAKDSLTTPDSLTQQQADQYETTLAQGLDRVHALDSLFALTNNPSYEAQRDSLQDSLLLVQQQRTALSSSFDNQKDMALTTVSTINSSISTNALFEQNDKLVNEVYLSTIAKGNFDCNSTQLSILIDIASQCPYEGGSAVFFARAMLKLVQEVDMDDLSMCNGAKALETQQRSAVEEENIVENDNIRLYPNPGRDFINVEVMENNDLQIEQIDIINLNGQVLQSLNNIKGNFVQIQTESLAPGLYLCRIIRSDQQSQIIKFAVIR